MDELQKKLRQMIKEQPRCIESRQRLKAMLADYLPSNKLHTNVLMNAYDEDVVLKMKTSNDASLIALRLIKQLKADYGLTDDMAFWSVQSWCIVLGLDDVVDALDGAKPQAKSSGQPMRTGNIAPKPSWRFRAGTYYAGEDLPAGDYKAINGDATNKTSVLVQVKDSSLKQVLQSELFNAQAYISIKNGQYLYVSGDVTLEFRK